MEISTANEPDVCGHAGAATSGEVTSGVAALDSLLGGGLMPGDNIVWFADELSDVDRYCEAFLDVGAPVQVITPSGPTAMPTPAELERLIFTPEVGEGTRLLVSSFDDLLLRWGAHQAVEFYTRTCPRLFDRGAIAYWTASRASTPPAVIDEVGRVAQCVLELRSGRLRVRKAEGRPLHVQGAAASIDLVGDRILVDREHTVGRLGEGLRRLRAERGLNQRELAQRAGVTPAAISQAESGRRGLSLDTVVRLCESLDVGLDDLLGIGDRSGPWLARHDRSVLTPAGTAPLFDDADAGARVHHVQLDEGQRGSPPQPHKGPEVVAVATGLVLVDLGESTPVLRAGDAVMASDVVVQGWTNLADGPSTLFWIAT